MHLATYASSKAPYKVAAPLQPRWKRGCDVLFCLAALPLLAVATLIMAVLMRVFSPGPILFTQERVGYMGRRFRIYKFRTMHVSAEPADHQQHMERLLRQGAPLRKLDAAGDRRLIPVGRLLRATGLDELPQIVNVLRGEMSIVGPRPCLTYETRYYSAVQFRRFHVLPGLTGLWQVSGKNNTTFEQMVALDLAYVRHRSFWGDVRIMALTPLVLAEQAFASLWRLRHVEPPLPSSGTESSVAAPSERDV